MTAVLALVDEDEAAHFNRAAFEVPTSLIDAPSSGRPLDLVHLARQTGGDRGLENEILQLFRQQLSLSADQIKMTSGRERKLIAHTIKGSARAVGAFGLSRIAAQIEDAPSDIRLISALELEIARIRDFIAGLNR